MNAGVVVHLDRFSGPLALLLHLIRKEEMDIFNINIHEITKQYLESIRAMKKLNLEVAGDFIAMAATLIQIKSKLLLPQYDESGEVIEDQDPRRDLVRRLLEYQMFQEAAQGIYKRNLLGRNVWARGQREEIKAGDPAIIIEEENALFSLISCYRLVVRSMKKAVHRVAAGLQSISERIWEMKDKLVVGRPTKLDELIDSDVDRRGQLLITFLSLLELAKIGLVRLFQTENFTEIHIETQGVIDKDSISKVENYESQIGQNVEAESEIWLSEDEQKIEIPERPVAMEEEIVVAATDEEIELEEKLYEQEA